MYAFISQSCFLMSKKTTKGEKSEPIPLNTLAGCKWWEIKVRESPVIETIPSVELGMDIYEETLSSFEALMKKDSEQQWLRKVSSTGTHSDQVSALITLTQMSPVLAMPHIRQLLNLAQVKANRIIQPALSAIKRLLVEELLPPNRKLVFFHEQSKGKTAYKSQILLWYFEDFLKKAVATFVQLLYDSQSSPIESIRTSCVDFSFDILCTIKAAHVSVEQEPALLRLLVKALGDKAEKRVSAKAALLLRKLAARRTHLKEAILDEVKDQHLVRAPTGAGTESTYSRGINMACSLFTTFPLNPQDDAFVAGKMVGMLSTFVNEIIAKKKERDRKRKLEQTCGLSEADAKILRLCLKALESSFAIAGSECPIPETTNSLLIRLSHETTLPGLSVAILNFLNRVSKELKTDSPKLVRAIYGQLANMSVYLGSSQLAWLLSLVKEAVLEDPFMKDSTKQAFRRRLMQIAACVSEPSVLTVVLALVEPKQLEAQLLTAHADNDDDEGPSMDERNKKFGYNPSFFDPVFSNVDSEPLLWERSLLKHHFESSVQVASDSLPVAVPEEVKSLSQLLVDVSTKELDEEKIAKKRKKRASVPLEDVEIEMPGI
jgi:hypothetical protein